MKSSSSVNGVFTNNATRSKNVSNIAFLFQNMMETIETFWLFILLNQLLLIDSTSADQFLLTTHTFQTGDYSERDTSVVFTTESYQNFDNSTFAPRGDCLIDTEMGLIAVGSAGGLIFCLLVATFILACQVCILQRRVHAPPTSLSNMDLVSDAQYWGTDQAEARGLLGPCDTDVMLEEVRVECKSKGKKQAELPEEADEGRQDGSTVKSSDPEEKVTHIQSSSSRDSCLEVPKDLEDMPLVV